MKEIGKYKIEGELGKGGMGVVYKAYDPLMERHVAIKVLSDWAFNQPVMKERFYREARASGKMSHENITIIHDLGEHENVPYIVMEFLSGTDLRALLKSNKKIDLIKKLNYASQICSALAYSHSKNIVHRDIKPENIRVLDDGKIKIMDFGIARLTTGTMTMTMTGTVMGTPFYMSPEQVKGEKVGNESDIFSFGVLLYELLTNQLPFPGDNPTTVSYKIVHANPEPITHVELVKIQGLQDLILKCLQKKPEDRFQNASEIATTLEKLISNLRQPQTVPARKKKDLVAEQFKAIQKKAITLVRKKQYADALVLLNQFINQNAGFQPAKTFLEEVKQQIAKSKEAYKKNKSKEKSKTYSTKKSNKNIFIYAGAALTIIAAFLLYNAFIPSSIPIGYVALNISPWAEVVGLSDGDGKDLKQVLFQDEKIITPQRLGLFPGDYTFKLFNPTFTDTLTVTISVVENQTTEINKKMPNFDYAQFIRNL